MFNMIIILLGALNSEPVGTNDYRICRFLLGNLENISAYNISQIAKACFVSISSVSRFCRKVGFQDFNDLKSQIYQLPAMSDSKFNYPEKDDSNIQDSYIEGVIHNLQLLKQSLDKDDIAELVGDLFSYKKVAAFGTLHSQSVVLNLQTDLLTSGIVVDTRSRFKEQLEYMENADEDTLVILFSRGGSHFKRFLINNLQLRPVHKPRIVMITTNRLQQKHKLIDKIICYEEAEGFTAYPFAFETIGSIIALEASIEKRRRENA